MAQQPVPRSSVENKPGFIAMESTEADQTLGLLSEKEAYDRTHNTFARRGLNSNTGKEHKSRPLWNLLKSALTVFWVGVLVYGLVRLFHRNPTETTSPHSQAPAICTTPECIHAASEILYSLDPNYGRIDPCSNFDQYVCGGWRERHDMRSDQSSIFTGTLMDENSEIRLKHLLESLDASQGEDANNSKKLKAAYDACLDEPAIRERGSKPLDELLAALQKIYPVKNDQASTTKDGLTSAILFLMKSGVSALVSPGVSPDDRDPDNVALFVGPINAIGLPTREYYNNTELVAKYTTVVKEVIRGFLGDGLGKIAEDIVAFEGKLADVTPDTQTQEDITKSYNPRSVKETESLAPEISFADIISELAPRDYQGDRLIIGSPSYLEALSVILKDAPRETVSYFLQWKLIQHYAKTIEDDKILPLRQFTNTLEGKDPQATEERWRKCIGRLDEDLGWSLSRLYVLNAFSEESKKLGDQIVSDIKERFVYTLDHTEWMSPDVRKLGIEKVGNIVQKIGFPTKSPNVLDPKDVENFYRDLDVSSTNYFENELAVAKFDLKREWSKLGKPTDRNEWDMTAPTVNAYYNPPGNEIVFPAGIMQPPVFYGPKAPLYLAYGAFGAVSGHELSHAFDSTGRHYDETGNYTDWWDSRTVQAFEERAQCFVDQYSKFTVEGPGGKTLNVNGRLTLGENIADAGGLTASFHAWKKHDNVSPDAHLPGLDGFTKEQLFFISYGNWWCGKNTKEAAEKAIYTDPHAPKAARNIETMANSREFKEAFSCPDKKPVCELW